MLKINRKIVFGFIVVVTFVAVLIALDHLTFTSKSKLDIAEHKGTISFFIEENIGEIAPESPILGGKWVVTETKYLSPDIVRVYYEDGHMTGILDLKITELKGSQITYKIIE